LNDESPQEIVKGRFAAENNEDQPGKNRFAAAIRWPCIFGGRGGT